MYESNKIITGIEKKKKKLIINYKKRNITNAMDTSTEKTDTTNIGSLFQQIINDLKVSFVIFLLNLDMNHFLRGNN